MNSIHRTHVHRPEFELDVWVRESEVEYGELYEPEHRIGVSEGDMVPVSWRVMDGVQYLIPESLFVSSSVPEMESYFQREYPDGECELEERSVGLMVNPRPVLDSCMGISKMNSVDVTVKLYERVAASQWEVAEKKLFFAENVEPLWVSTTNPVAAIVQSVTVQ